MGVQRVSVQIRRDTKANWDARNTILLDGQLAMEIDGTNKNFKIGDGETAWEDLPYILQTTATGSTVPIFIYHKFTADSATFQDDQLIDRVVSQLDMSYDKVNISADGNGADVSFNATTGTLTRVMGVFKQNLILKIRIWP